MNKIKIILLFMFLIAIGCKESKPVYVEGHENLKSLISVKTGVDMESTKKSVVIILQKVDCICTEENMELANQIVVDSQFKGYMKILIVKGDNHKFLSKVKDADKDHLRIIIDDNDVLMKAGFLATTDRIIVFESGVPQQYYDLHITKPHQIRSKIFPLS